MQILIEGYTLEELLNFPDEVLSAYVFIGEPIVFKAGSAEILGNFQKVNNYVVIELAQIDGGGEGVLPALWILANRQAAKRGLSHVEWIVHAVDCARPNLKLRHLLERRGFVIEEVEGIGAVYHLVHEI